MFSKRPSTFISYRRDDTIGHVGRLHDRLASKWGGKQIYWDIDNIPPGDDFLSAIDNTLTNCDLVLLVIGPKWLLAADSNGRPRLEDVNDFHRLEIERAIQLKKRIIPILVNGATLPSTSELPSSISAIRARNAFEISDKRFDFDSAQLIKSIEIWFSKRAAESRNEYHSEYKPEGSQEATSKNGFNSDGAESGDSRLQRSDDGAAAEHYEVPQQQAVSKDGLKRWVAVSPPQAREHRLYGVKGWAAVFAVFILAMPIQATYFFLAESVGFSALPWWEAIFSDSDQVVYLRANAIVSAASSCIILPLVLFKSSFLRTASMLCLGWGWPLTKFLGTGEQVSPIVQREITNSFLVWFLAFIIWIPWLYFSARARVTFESRIRRTDA